MKNALKKLRCHNNFTYLDLTCRYTEMHVAVDLRIYIDTL